MPLLGKDHLARGRGEIRVFNQICWSISEISVVTLSALLIFTKSGPTIASYFCPSSSSSSGEGGNEDSTQQQCLSIPLAEERPLHAYVFMFSIIAYFCKTLYWNWFYSHSNTISIAAVLFVGVCYHYFLVSSIIVPAYIVNRIPSTWEIVFALSLELLSLIHETFADREMSQFKSTKKKGELLDYGYHSACRHPNYFFNSFPIGCIGMLSGSKLVGIMWCAIQVFWACTQSGPALEAYMADNYGKKWEKYCKVVPFLIPKPKHIYKILMFQYIGTKADKIKASGRASMFDISAAELKALQEELAELEETETFDDSADLTTKKAN
mmetsp:Transcript_44260/g.107035  ORF Transcript_44260/g.107035 Transcript_44260/m.107035 type:complete len:324 (+) Transcript_44260:585-1556(+)